MSRMYEWIIIVVIILVLFVIIYTNWISVKAEENKQMFSFDNFLKHSDINDIYYRPLTVSYQIYQIPKLVSNSDCYDIYQQSKPLLQPSKTLSLLGCTLDTLTTDIIKHKASKISGFPLSHMEPLIITCYQENDSLTEHFDMVTNSIVSTRVCTMIVYLNDDYKGGEIEFPNIDTLFIPEMGKALFFWVSKDGVSLYESKYLARPVYLKQKWLATLYIHSCPIR